MGFAFGETVKYSLDIVYSYLFSVNAAMMDLHDYAFVFSLISVYWTGPGN